MSGLKKYLAGGFVFAFIQWLAYLAFTGGDFTTRERGGAKGVEDLIGWLTGQIGNVPAAAVISILGVVLGYVAYKRMERLTQG